VTPYLSSEITPNLSVKNEDFVRLVRAVRLNKAVKAVVLRVDR
jgi:ClpP class serine protease